MKTVYSLFIFLFLSGSLLSQNSLQTIRGVVLDKQSQITLPGASLTLLPGNPPLGISSDLDGKFKFQGIKPGRYDLKVSMVGYNELVVPNIELTVGKEIVLEIGLEENIRDLKEVVITGTTSRETQNEMTSVSARSFTMEEVNRYAGGRSDPSRLAANFAGVSSPDDSRNDLVIRGNSPTGVLWRIEGLNTPNLNHFATIGTTGGPVSAINTNVIRSSDFFTSAFPSEYGNANAGVFDLGFRNGNSERFEQTIQLGALTGLEAVTEGPINKEKGSSFLVAYRYAFTGVAQAIGLPIGTTATPFYSDLSFKINGGSTKLGKFTLFGLAANSKIEFLHSKTDTTDLFADPTKDSYFTSDIGLAGLKHVIRVNEKGYFNTVLGATYNGSNFLQDRVNSTNDETTREIENKASQIRYSLNTSYNHKFSSKLFLKTGIISELIELNLFAKELTKEDIWNQYWDFKDQTILTQGYAQFRYKPVEKLTFNLGVHGQWLKLNDSYSIGPRLGVKYAVHQNGSINLGYGLHSQMQPTDVYFYRERAQDGSYQQNNINLGFTQSHHFVLGYDLVPFEDWRLKTEVYYQSLFDVPVHTFQSSYSMLNTGASFLPNFESNLENRGTGRNYGAELTIEKFFSRGYYALITGTLYESKYKGSDGIERNTAFNTGYIYNILAGKDIKVGKDKRNTLNIGFKLTQSGGRYYTPVDLEASQLKGAQVLKGDDYAFTSRNPNFFRLDVKIGYTQNSKHRKLSQTWSFDIQNVSNHKNVFAERYNPVTNQINTAYQIGFFPNFVYRVQF